MLSQIYNTLSYQCGIKFKKTASNNLKNIQRKYVLIRTKQDVLFGD